jgi:hypothetical protein
VTHIGNPADLCLQVFQILDDKPAPLNPHPVAAESGDPRSGDFVISQKGDVPKLSNYIR